MTIAVWPGELLVEALVERGMSQAEFAKRCALSQKHVSRFVHARAHISAEVALRFELVLGIAAVIWLQMQADWDLEQARKRVPA